MMTHGHQLLCLPSKCAASPVTDVQAPGVPVAPCATSMTGATTAVSHDCFTDAAAALGVEWLYI